MRKKGYKGRCEKRQLAKCPEVCRTYDEIQNAYADVLQANKLVKTNSKLFALQKQKGVVQTALDQIPGGILHRKERKALQERIDGLERQIKQTQDQMNVIPKQHGYENVRAVKKAYTDAKAALDEVRRKQAEWDGVTYPEVQKPQHQSQKVSVLKQLAAKQVEVSNQEHRSSRSKGIEL